MNYKNDNIQTKDSKRVRHYDRVMTCYKKMKNGNMFESAHIVDAPKKNSYGSEETCFRH